MTVKYGIITMTSQLHILSQDQPATYPGSRPDDGEVWHNNYDQPATYPVSRPASYISCLKTSQPHILAQDQMTVKYGIITMTSQLTTYPVSIHILAQDQMTVKYGIITITSQLHILAQDQPATYPVSRPANHISWHKTSQLHILAQDQPTTYPGSRPANYISCLKTR